MRWRAAGAAALAGIVLGGCMVGPDYVRPSAPMTPAFKETDGWKVAEPSDHLPKGAWWEVFGDAELNALQLQLDPANQNLRIAEARLREARAAIRFNRAALFPTLSGSFGPSIRRESANQPFLSQSASTNLRSGDLLASIDLSYEVDLWGRIRRTVAAARHEATATAADLETALFPTLSGSFGPSIRRESANQPFLSQSASTNLRSGDLLASIDLSYEVDLWGRIRRTVAAARHEATATAADLETARLSLHAELAMDYFQLQAVDAQKQLLDETVTAFEAALKLTTTRFQGGAAPKSDVAQAQTQLDTTRAQATDVTVQRAQLEHAIAILLGRPPADFGVPPRPLDTRPPDVPVGLPSQLLERRPDIAAAERRVAEANEQIGIAKAAYYPALVLNASVGFEGTTFGNLLNASSLLWSVGASLTQTIFDGGRRRATSDSVRAAYDATVAGYRQTTLTAFQEVEDNVAALRILEQEARQQRQAVESAQQSLQLFTIRYRGGVDNYLQVITAQTVTLSNQRTEIDILGRRMTASVLLVKALGGGWDVADLPKPTP